MNAAYAVVTVLQMVHVTVMETLMPVVAVARMAHLDVITRVVQI